MMYGNKHCVILQNYDNSKYDFRPFLKKCFNLNDTDKLDDIHKIGYKYDRFVDFGQDTQTWYHSTFYKFLKSENGKTMKSMYNNLIRDIILPYLELKEAYVQNFPSFRIQLPDNVAVAKMHNDSSLGHPYGEVNFTYSFTDMYDTNTIFIEKESGKNNFVPLLLKENNNISFNGNQCLHYNELNKTGKTRISMDYRILPVNYYLENNKTLSYSSKTKFVENEYYDFVQL